MKENLRKGGKQLAERMTAVVAGGDLRQVYAANALAQRGFSVTALGFSKEQHFNNVRASEDLSVLEQADLVLFPLMMSKDGKLNTPLSNSEVDLNDCFDKIPQTAQIFGGNLTKEEKQLAEQKGLLLRDFFKVEELTVANAVLTAEAAIQLAMEQLPISLWKSRVLICGGGRVARALITRLKAFGVELTVAARKPEQRIWAAAEGVKTISLSALSTILPEQQLIFNTIPQRIFGESELTLCEEECLIMELASKPYGIDFAAAEKLKRRTLLAAALPGKHSPQTAGEWIADTILNMRKG